MFGINEYQIAACVSLIVMFLWVISFILTEVWRYSWAWVDDSEPSKENLIVSKMRLIRKSDWKYPVFNCSKEYEKDPERRGEIFGYAMDEKFNETSCHTLDEGIDYYYYPHNDNKVKDSLSIYAGIIPVSILLPFCVLLFIKFYIIIIFIGTFILIANLTRFSRRLSKRFKLHEDDKKIHNINEEGGLR